MWVQYDSSIDEASLVHAGNEDKKTKLYIGQALFKDKGIMPGKVFFDENGKAKCSIGWNGEIITTEDFKVLKKHPKFFWQSGQDGKVPSDALVGGLTKEGEEVDKLYIGRFVKLDGNCKVGKIHPRYKNLFALYNGKEEKEFRYETLVMYSDNGKYFLLHV